MEQAVQNGAGQGAVVVKDLGPVFVGLVGREHDGTAFVALADDLEEQLKQGLSHAEVCNPLQPLKLTADCTSRPAKNVMLDED